MPNPLHKIIGDLLKNRISLQPTPKEYQLISNRVQFYHIVISNHFLYYLNLPDAGKLRFLKIEFITSVNASSFILKRWKRNLRCRYR
jgi:hypothetical protein